MPHYPFDTRIALRIPQQLATQLHQIAERDMTGLSGTVRRLLASSLSRSNGIDSRPRLSRTQWATTCGVMNEAIKRAEQSHQQDQLNALLDAKLALVRVVHEHCEDSVLSQGPTSEDS